MKTSAITSTTTTNPNENLLSSSTPASSSSSSTSPDPPISSSSSPTQSTTTTIPTAPTPPSHTLTPREKYVEEFYNAANVPMFTSLDYTILTPSPEDSLIITDETRCMARILFGDRFDIFVRWFAVKYWLHSLLLQLICMSFGVYLLTSPNSFHYLNILCLPGSVFPLLLLLRSHYKIIFLMCQEWEPLFLTSYTLLFCISNVILVKNSYSFIFIFFVLFPTLLSCIFCDASSLRLDYAFVKGNISSAALALPPCLVSLGGIVAILVTNIDGYNGVELGSYSIIGYAKSFVWTAGFTLCIFIGKSIVHIVIFPHKCVSIQTPLVITSVTLDTNERFSTIQENEKMTCSLLLTGHFDYMNGEIKLSKTTTENPLTYRTTPSISVLNALEADIDLENE